MSALLLSSVLDCDDLEQPVPTELAADDRPKDSPGEFGEHRFRFRREDGLPHAL